MAKVCVSVPTDDEKTVKLGHFGDARYYLHFVYEDGGWRLLRRVENPYAGHHHHGEEEGEEHGKRPKILGLQEGCSAVVATAFGPGGEDYMRRRGLVVVKVRPRTSIEEALREAEKVLGVG